MNTRGQSYHFFFFFFCFFLFLFGPPTSLFRHHFVCGQVARVMSNSQRKREYINSLCAYFLPQHLKKSPAAIKKAGWLRKPHYSYHFAERSSLSSSQRSRNLAAVGSSSRTSARQTKVTTQGFQFGADARQDERELERAEKELTRERKRKEQRLEELEVRERGQKFITITEEG